MKKLRAFFDMTFYPKLHYISLVGAVLIAGSSLWLEQQDWNAHSFLKLGWLTIGQYSLLATCMLISWLSGPKTNRIADYKWLIIASVSMRFLLFPVEPYTSNDVDRYLFDGKVAISGFDPYRISHDAEDLVELRQEWAPPKEHAQYATLYPPVALGLFSLAASAGVNSAIWVWKALVTLASLGTLYFMLLVLQRHNVLRHFSLIALSPLLVLEAGAGAHIDTFSTLAISAALYFWTSKRLFYTGVALGLGALSKILPILLLMPLVLSLSNIRHMSTLISGAILTLFAGYASAFLLGLHPIGSISIFFQKWRNGSPLFDFIQNNVAAPNILPSVILFVFVTLSVVAYYSWQNRNISLNAKALQWTLIIPLLISPVVFPWYLMPLVPLFALSPNIFLLLWFVLLPLTYEVQNQFACCATWEPANWPITLLSFGMLAGLVIDRIIATTSQTGIENNAKTP